MSKNITIQEGGVAKQMTVDKLKTNLVGSGTCLWVPEDEVQLTTKTITENGTHKASDDGYYGYSEVTVSGIGTATGTDPTTGEDTTVTTGPGGELETTVLPHSIRVDTPPTITTYADGATIDFSGMVVKAYLKSGGLWTDTTHPNGIIPISELILPVTTADKSSVTEQEASSDIVQGSIPCASRITFEGHHSESGRTITDKWELLSDGLICVKINNASTWDAIFASGGTPSFWTHRLSYWDDTGEYIQNTYYDETESAYQYTYAGETVTYKRHIWSTTVPIESLSISQANFNNNNAPQTAWTMIYGTHTGGAQTVPVQWTRPRDYSTLESSFDITVT